METNGIYQIDRIYDTHVLMVNNTHHLFMYTVMIVEGGWIKQERLGSATAETNRVFLTRHIMPRCNAMRPRAQL